MLYRTLASGGVNVPVIGQGTWKFGENPATARQEIEALRFGIAQGMTLLDTAEEYAKGGSERIVGEAIEGMRQEVLLVTKVSARNCSYEGVLQAAEASLERLKTSYIDLYLQHWPSDTYEVAETMEAMAQLVRSGMIKHVGVSNFSVELMEQAQAALGDIPLACNQVAYHLNDRHIEFEILPYCREKGILVMGYSPFGYAPHVFGKPGFPAAGTPERELLEAIGAKYGKTAYQVALNWAIRLDGLISIPKAVKQEHLLDNVHSIGWELEAEDLEQIELAFPR